MPRPVAPPERHDVAPAELESYDCVIERFRRPGADTAAAGVGLIAQSTHVGSVSRMLNLQATPWLKEAIPSYRKVADMVHEHGAEMMAEIWYAPQNAKMREPLGPEAPVRGSTTAQQWSFASVRHGMTKREIKKFADFHGQSVRHLREAGYGGVEVHASHGALIEHFISPYFNRRIDEYGAGMENRARILIEALEQARQRVGMISRSAFGSTRTSCLPRDSMRPPPWNSSTMWRVRGCSTSLTSTCRSSLSRRT